MGETIIRIYVEKKKPFDIEAKGLFNDLKENLGLQDLISLRFLNRYDISGITQQEYNSARSTIFSEPPVDIIYEEMIPLDKNETVIAIEYLPGQYDQRADSAAQCIQIITQKLRPQISAARIIILKSNSPIPSETLSRIKNYLINPVDSREASLNKPSSFQTQFQIPPHVTQIEGFIRFSSSQLEQFRKDSALAMSLLDLTFCQDYFKNEEKRDPFITEIKMLDTYWSDHCRHTTFRTKLDPIRIEDSPYTSPIKTAFETFKETLKTFSPQSSNPLDICLMDIATISMKEMRKKGLLDDMEISGEVNACSIIREVIVNDKKEEWLIMFKNETHNHPTEIEPFGGAATCLGGAIRDPLSGRAFVYQAMRVTGSGNPLQKVEDTLPGKLPQRKITTQAAHGYSSYGNQIGVPTGQVSEIYHDGYMAKRMEVGAVIGAVPKDQVLRLEPVPGDIVLMVGGRTGRDGIGGATGSSREHTEDSIYTAGAEVQKGNAPEERKLQRLYRNPQVCRLIKKSNDFGAGGVSVAVGELADGLEIYLDNVPKKYEGLDGTELALSESQERMAVVVAPENVDEFKQLADLENLEVTQIATVTSPRRLKMIWRNETIVDISRDFIDTHGVRLQTPVTVPTPSSQNTYFNEVPTPIQNALNANQLRQAWLACLTDLNVASQRGLGEYFDCSVGAGTILIPFGGKYQLTPIEAMAAKVPHLSCQSQTATLMSYGYNPYISSWSPFHGAVYSVIEAVAKIVAAGGDYSTVRTSLQEYFEKPQDDPKRWGKPFSALLGAYYTLRELGIAAIGGKDSMSGTFKNLDVPPTLITFAVDTTSPSSVLSPEFKKTQSTIVYIPLERDQAQMPLFEQVRKNYAFISKLIKEGKVLSAQTVRHGGIAAAISRMAFGNKIGFRFQSISTLSSLFLPQYGSFLLEVDNTLDIPSLFAPISYQILGHTQEKQYITLDSFELSIDEALSAWESVFEPLFPTHSKRIVEEVPPVPYYITTNTRRPLQKFAKPRVLVTIFPGTNCEYETQAAFQKFGAIANTFVFRNLTPSHIHQSLEELALQIQQSQIVVIPGGFSAGDEPDGSGKFIAAVFRNPNVSQAVMELLNKRDGLMLGICNGFQALIKLGLVPYGEIRDIHEDSPTLTFNGTGRYVSRMVRTRIQSSLSPWFIHHQPGQIHIIPSAHGEGRFIAPPQVIARLFDAGQVATQYVDPQGNPTMHPSYNPNASMNAIEGITSPDGRVLGKMGHTERITPYVAKNVPGDKDQKLFKSGIDYFS